MSIRPIVMLTALFLVGACSSSAALQARSSLSPIASPTPVAEASPSLLPGQPPKPGPTPSAAPTPFPSPSPSPVGTRVAPEVLKPATTLPVATLCSTPVFNTADGNVEPRFCRDGSINVIAWTAYSSIGPHVLAAGRNATTDQIQAAINADFGLHATDPEELFSYELAAAYYGWKYSPSQVCVFIYGGTTC